MAMNWFREQTATRCVLIAATGIACCLGCQTAGPHQSRAQQPFRAHQAVVAPTQDTQEPRDVRLASHQQPTPDPEVVLSPRGSRPEWIATGPKVYEETLEDLEALATINNPTLRRLSQEAAAEWAKTGYVAKLPDPSVGTMVYTPPMNFDPDRQLAELQVTQMIPWLSRLSAEARRAHLEAMAADNMYQAERLRVVGDLRATWFKLYVLGKQISTTQADQAQLESLIKTANARIATGDAQPGDVLMATLELSSLQEQLISYRQQVAAASAELNRLAGRDASLPVAMPAALNQELPEWDHELLRHIALESQPELNAARLRTAATRWGIEVARLKRRPDLTFGAGWIVMDAPGATMPGAGTDSFTLGVTATVPIWHRKYDAMTAEASREHAAAHASEDEVALRLDAQLRDLWEQAKASQKTIELYEKSILPQARQTFEADQKSLINNTVTFDRVIRDYRTLLSLELGYHRALGELATTLARIRQTIGIDLLAEPAEARSGGRAGQGVPRGG
jgi:cobalt-zinc-cadmium efflux system outer membrane protein